MEHLTNKRLSWGGYLSFVTLFAFTNRLRLYIYAFWNWQSNCIKKDWIKSTWKHKVNCSWIQLQVNWTSSKQEKKLLHVSMEDSHLKVLTFFAGENLPPKRLREIHRCTWKVYLLHLIQKNSIVYVCIISVKSGCRKQLILIPLIGDGKLNAENFVRFWWNFHRRLKTY